MMAQPFKYVLSYMKSKYVRVFIRKFYLQGFEMNSYFLFFSIRPQVISIRPVTYLYYVDIIDASLLGSIIPYCRVHRTIKVQSIAHMDVALLSLGEPKENIILDTETIFFFSRGSSNIFFAELSEK